MLYFIRALVLHSQVLLPISAQS